MHAPLFLSVEFWEWSSKTYTIKAYHNPVYFVSYIYIYLTHGNTVIIYTKIQRDQMHHGEESLCCKFSIQKVLPHYKLRAHILYTYQYCCYYFFYLCFQPIVTNACTRSFITWTCTIQDPLYNDFDVFQEKPINMY